MPLAPSRCKRARAGLQPRHAAAKDCRLCLPVEFQIVPAYLVAIPCARSLPLARGFYAPPRQLELAYMCGDGDQAGVVVERPIRTGGAIACLRKRWPKTAQIPVLQRAQSAVSLGDCSRTVPRRLYNKSAGAPSPRDTLSLPLSPRHPCRVCLPCTAPQFCAIYERGIDDIPSSLYPLFSRRDVRLGCAIGPAPPPRSPAPGALPRRAPATATCAGQEFLLGERW